MEYNQLDPLLREGEGAGDVNEPDTGFSAYPGNINQLVFALDPYNKVRFRVFLENAAVLLGRCVSHKRL